MKKCADNTAPCRTYCNPLPIPSIPRGKDGWYTNERGMFSHENRPAGLIGEDYRSISDPTVFLWEGRWYLYPSYGMAWVSEDFCTWRFHRTEPYCPKYSPAIIPWKGRFLLTSWACPLYVSDSPLGPFEELGPFIGVDGEPFVVTDPALFVDDDGRIYLYGFHPEPIQGSRFFCSQTVGWELDQNNPRQALRGPVVLQEMDPAHNVWERSGNHNQNVRFGWMEGVHMLKHNGRYYMIYAAPNTEFQSYCMAVSVSDDGPLSGFRVQKRNPLTLHREGLVQGCGHGCVEHAPDGSLWAFYTVAVPYLHMYERRIGMDRVEVDENGELYCPDGVTDTPQYAPCSSNSGNPGWLPLNAWCRPTASSCAPGRDPLYAVDRSSLSWWQPAPDDAEPMLLCDLTDPYVVCAARIFWRERNLDYANGICPGAIRYVIEGASEDSPEQWFILSDRSDSTEDFNIDYRVFAPKSCRWVRLRILGAPAGVSPGVIDFTVFGYMQ